MTWPEALRLLATMVVLPAAPLAAQICNGTTAFAYGPVRAGASAQVGDNLAIVEAQAAVGMPKGGLFGGFGRGHRKFAGSGSKMYAMQVGYSMPLAWSGRVQGCPVAAMEIRPGFDVEEGVGLDSETIESRATGIGYGAGAKLISRATFELIPFASISHFGNAQDVTYHNVKSTTHAQTWVMAGGVGFVFEKQMTLRPTVVVTMHDQVGKPTYGIVLSMAIPGGTRTK